MCMAACIIKALDRMSAMRPGCSGYQQCKVKRGTKGEKNSNDVPQNHVKI